LPNNALHRATTDLQYFSDFSRAHYFRQSLNLTFLKIGQRLRWPKNGLFHRPACFQTMLDSPMRSTDQDCPFSENFCFTVDSEPAVLSSIVLVLCSCGPMAITRLIRSIIINAIKFQSWRAWPHITVKRFKAIFPRIANRYSTPTIIFVTSVAWIKTALLHGDPAHVFAAISGAPRLSVLSLKYSTTLVPAQVNFADKPSLFQKMFSADIADAGRISFAWHTVQRTSYNAYK